MKRTPFVLLVAALGLTACTDQPVESEPTPTATITETVTVDPSATLPSEDQVTDAIGTILEHSDPAQLPQGAAALEELSGMLNPPDAEDPTDEGEASCPAVFEVQPEVAGYGVAESEAAEDHDEKTSLAALGFATPDEATELTDQIQQFVEACPTAQYELETLTHHTDEAFEIRQTETQEQTTSVMFVRNANWVYVTASTPAADVALALTLVDQLDETLR